MAQRYSNPLAHRRMAEGTCPECGNPADSHSGDPRFWMRPGGAGCDLLPQGVTGRIAQYEEDARAEVSPS